MPATPSTMVPLGTPAPDFRLPDTDGKQVALADFAGSKALLVAFICNHCPFVKHVQAAFAQLAREYQARGVAVVGINSNDVANHPDDSPAKMVAEKKAAGYTFPYLYDESQEVAQAYRAACTPDFFLFDQDRKLVYRGQMDASRPGNGKPTTVPTCGLPSTPCWPARNLHPSRCPALGATSSGSPATSRSTVDRGQAVAKFTHRQGQFLAFIYLYTKLHRRSPAELDMVRYFGLTPPSVHSMVVKLHELGLITRQPGQARSIRVAISKEEIPELEDVEGPPL